MKFSELIKDIRGMNIPPLTLRWSVRGLDAILTAALVVEVEKRHGVGVVSVDTSYLGKVVAALARQNNARFGLLLCGSVGSGKTTMAAAIVRAAAYVRRIGGVAPDYSFKHARSIQRVSGGVVIDDIGTEAAEVLDYGNVHAPISEAIEDLYMRRLPFVLTSNMKPQSIGERYGERVADRLRECCEVISFGNVSRRK